MNHRTQESLLLLAVASMVLPLTASADTMYLQGRMGGRVSLEIAERYDPAPGTDWISLTSYRTPSFGSTTWRQTVVSEEVGYSTRPVQASVTVDTVGNSVLTERWERPTTPLEIVRKVVVDTEVSLIPIQSQAPFPVASLPADAARFLRATPMTQREAPMIVDLARRLTAGAQSEQDAVAAILNYVIDHLQYQYD